MKTFINNFIPAFITLGLLSFGHLSAQPYILDITGDSRLNGKVEVNSEGYESVGGFDAGQLQIKSNGTNSNAGAFISGHNSKDENTQLWYLGSKNNTDKDVAFFNRKSGSLLLGTNNQSRMTIASNGNVHIANGINPVQFRVSGESIFAPVDPLSFGLNFSVKIAREIIEDPEFGDYHHLNVTPEGDFSSFYLTSNLGTRDKSWENLYAQNINMGPSLGSGKLQLYSSGASSYGMGVTAGHFKFYISNPQAKFAFYDSYFVNNEIFTINGNGTFGFNDPTPAHTLSVNGTVSKPGGGSWIASSDRRLKNNIRSFDLGMELIEKIKPKTFQYNGKLNLPTETEYIGVVAEELQKAAPFMVSEFEGADGETYLAVDPSAFDYILINAVKEVKAEKDKEIAALQSEIAELKEMMDAFMGQNTLLDRIEQPPAISSTPSTDLLLSQNQPNPFSQTTIIQYNIPNTRQNASIHIADLNGKILKSYPISHKGKGNITVKGNTLTTGMYLYILKLDGEVVATKKMVLTK